MSRVVLLRVLPVMMSFVLLLGAAALALAGQHCGAEGDWRSNLVPDYWPPQGVKTNWLPGAIKKVPVYKSCIKHDQCYDRPGATQKECDHLFLDDMRAQCGRVYRNMLDAVHREACQGAAKGYYQAVAKYGGPAFALAQAKHKRPEAKDGAGAGPVSQEQAQAVYKARPNDKTSQVQSGGKANPLKWRLWGKLEGVGGLAAMHGAVYAYKPSTSQVFTSPASKCAWQSLGFAPKGKDFAAGQGNLFLTGVQDGEIWTMRPGVKPWRSLGPAPGTQALAISGAHMFGWFNPGGFLRSSRPRSLKWNDMGRVKDVVSLAGDGGKLYCLSVADLRVSWCRKGQPPWQALGWTQAAGRLAADRRMLYLAVPSTGAIFRAAVP